MNKDKLSKINEICNKIGTVDSDTIDHSLDDKIELARVMSGLETKHDVIEYLLDKYLNDEDNSLMTIEDTSKFITIGNYSGCDYPEIFDTKTGVMINYIAKEVDGRYEMKSIHVEVNSFKEMCDNWNKFCDENGITFRRCITSTYIEPTEFDKNYMNLIKNTMLYHNDKASLAPDEYMDTILSGFKNVIDSINSSLCLYWPHVVSTKEDGVTKRTLYKFWTDSDSPKSKDKDFDEYYDED